MLERLLKRRNMNREQLSFKSGIPSSTIDDICDGKIEIENCSEKTLCKLAASLDVSMEVLMEFGIVEAKRERTYEYGLPDYLQHDLDAYKEGLKKQFIHNGLFMGRTLWKY